MTAYSKNQIFRIEYDKVSPFVTYVGKAPVGASTAASVWQIFKFTKSGGLQRTLYVDGNVNFDNVWDDRLVLAYV